MKYFPHRVQINQTRSLGHVFIYTTSYKPVRHFCDASHCAAYEITEIRALSLQYWMSRYILDVYDTVLFMDGSKNNVSATLQKNIGQNMYSLLILSHQ